MTPSGRHHGAVRVIEIEDPILVVLIGAAGSGKSTFAARHFAADEILSSDAFRALVAGDAADQRASGLAFRRLHEELARRLARGRLSVVDATNLTPHARRVLLARAATPGCAARPSSWRRPTASSTRRTPSVPAARCRPTSSIGICASLRELLASGRLDAEGFAAIHRLEGTVRPDRITIVRRPGVHRGARDRPRVDI